MPYGLSTSRWVPCGSSRLSVTEENSACVSKQRRLGGQDRGCAHRGERRKAIGEFVLPGSVELTDGDLQNKLEISNYVKSAFVQYADKAKTWTELQTTAYAYHRCQHHQRPPARTIEQVLFVFAGFSLVSSKYCRISPGDTR